MDELRMGTLNNIMYSEARQIFCFFLTIISINFVRILTLVAVNKLS